MKKLRGTILTLFVVMAAVFSGLTLNTMTAQAKNVKAVTNYRKAKSLKKGKNRINYSNTHGKGSYVKFKAPKTGKYVFTGYNLKSNKKDEATGLNIDTINFSIGPMKWGSIYQLYCKTEGGKALSAYITTYAAYELNVMKKMPNPYLASRSMTIKMKKGQTYYIYISDNNGSGAFTMTVKKK